MAEVVLTVNRIGFLLRTNISSSFPFFKRPGKDIYIYLFHDGSRTASLGFPCGLVVVGSVVNTAAYDKESLFRIGGHADPIPILEPFYSSFLISIIARLTRGNTVYEFARKQRFIDEIFIQAVFMIILHYKINSFIF